MRETVRIVDWFTGSVELGRPTGLYEQAPNGYWYEVYTDTIHRDQNGVEVERKPTEAVVGISVDPRRFLTGKP